MREVLPLGTIVKLKHGPEKLMIICRLPLFNNMGTIGYFDYSACLYPAGQASQQSYFFNREDIEEVCFEGFRDEEEEKYCEVWKKALENISYPRLQLKFEEE
jgi:hypothetical protein